MLLLPTAPVALLFLALLFLALLLLLKWQCARLFQHDTSSVLRHAQMFAVGRLRLPARACDDEEASLLPVGVTPLPLPVRRPMHLRHCVYSAIACGHSPAET